MKRTTHPDKAITCPVCLTLNSHSAAFCRKCGSPIGKVATLDPMQTIQAEGFLLRKALEGRQGLIVLLGIWILNLLPVVVGVAVAIYILLYERGLGNWFFFWALLGASYIGFVILYRVTKNYLTTRKKG